MNQEFETVIQKYELTVKQNSLEDYITESALQMVDATMNTLQSQSNEEGKTLMMLEKEQNADKNAITAPFYNDSKDEIQGKVQIMNLFDGKMNKSQKKQSKKLNYYKVKSQIIEQEPLMHQESFLTMRNSKVLTMELKQDQEQVIQDLNRLADSSGKNQADKLEKGIKGSFDSNKILV